MSRPDPVTSIELFSKYDGFNNAFTNCIASMLTEPKDILNVSHSCAFFRRNMRKQLYDLILAPAINKLTPQLITMETILKNIDQRNLPGKKTLIADIISRAHESEQITTKKIIIEFFTPDSIDETMQQNDKIAAHYKKPKKIKKLSPSEFSLKISDASNNVDKFGQQKYTDRGPDIVIIVSNNHCKNDWITNIYQSQPKSATIALTKIDTSYQTETQSNPTIYTSPYTFTFILNSEHIEIIFDTLNLAIATHLDKLYPVQKNNPNSQCLIM